MVNVFPADSTIWHRSGSDDFTTGSRTVDRKQKKRPIWGPLLLHLKYRISNLKLTLALIGLRRGFHFPLLVFLGFVDKIVCLFQQ
jgi:hypothetical protein